MYQKIFVTGHRNPDMDSLGAAVGLAELRRREGNTNVEGICPGVMPERARYIFNRFGIKEPASRGDLYVRVSDIMTSCPEKVTVGTTLWHGLLKLKEMKADRLPVVDVEGHYVGMLSPMGMLDKLMMSEQRHLGAMSSRAIESSIELITQVIEGEILAGVETQNRQRFLVYVTAMSIEGIQEHIPSTLNMKEIALIVGDRPEIHQWAIDRGVRLMIVTGDMSVSDEILKQAVSRGVSIVRSPKDSAKVIRRLIFSVPVEEGGLRGQTLILHPEERVREIASAVLGHFEDDIPVIDSEGRLVGILSKQDIIEKAPFGVILVDHNEIEQSLPGVEHLPLLEVVDHHRLHAMPTDHPIRFTADVVGSTCTLVARMFKEAGQSLTSGLAGVLLAGIVTDTLNLKSPTTAELDVKMCHWLSQICGVTGETLVKELSSIASPLGSGEAMDVLNIDRKNYVENGLSFSLSQVEETNLRLLDLRIKELREAMSTIKEQEQLTFLGLMVTDPVRLNSRLLVLGDEKIVNSLPYRHLSNGVYDMPGILSRKKQLLPQILISIRAAINKP